MKRINLLLLLLAAAGMANAQGLTLPAGGGNLKSSVSQRVGITDIVVKWDAPGVKGREGRIWGSPVVHYGFQNLGFGTSKEAPWRAGANENTTMYFSTDVNIEGKPLAAGKYGFHIAVYADSCTLIFSKNNGAWGSFFYDPKEDALRVTVRQEKNQPESREWLAYEFSNPTDHSLVVSLNWERWRIPFEVSVDVNQTTIASIKRQLQSDVGFHADNWIAAAQFCLQNNTNLEDGLAWAENAANFGPVTFFGMSLKSQLQEKLGRPAEAEKTMTAALDKGSVQELHQYGRQLITQKNPAKAMEVFQMNYKKNGDTWPTHVGLMRGYSAMGDVKKAYEHALIAQKQAPDDLNKRNLENSVKMLSEGKALVQ